MIKSIEIKKLVAKYLFIKLTMFRTKFINKSAHESNSNVKLIRLKILKSTKMYYKVACTM